MRLWLLFLFVGCGTPPHRETPPPRAPEPVPSAVVVAPPVESVPTPPPSKAPEPEPPVLVTLGKSVHHPGDFVFPDGFHLKITKVSECDFDPADPCPVGGTFRLDATFRSSHETVQTKRRLTPILGHTVSLGVDDFIVRVK